MVFDGYECCSIIDQIDMGQRITNARIYYGYNNNYWVSVWLLVVGREISFPWSHPGNSPRCHRSPRTASFAAIRLAPPLPLVSAPLRCGPLLRLRRQRSRPLPPRFRRRVQEPVIAALHPTRRFFRAILVIRILKTPRRPKTPFQPRQPDQSFRHKIFADQERLIGRIIVAWSRLEYTMEEVIWSFLNVQIEEGRVITSRLDATFKMNILRGLALYHLDGRNAAKFSDLLNTIQDLYADRNVMAHAKWGTLLPEQLPAAASLRAKDNQVPPENVIVETYPRHRMIPILQNIVRSMNTLIKVLNAHETLHGRPIPPRRQP
jgi:hypothetical protein